MGREGHSGGKHAGVRLSHLNVLLICIGLVLSVLMAVSMYQITNSVKEVVTVTDDYLSNQQTGGMLRDYTQSMADQAMAFVQSADSGYARIYDAKMKTINARLEQYTPESSNSEAANRAFRKAVTAFTERQAEELRAIRLAADSVNEPARGTISSLLQKTELSPEEQALSPEEKRAAALSILTAEEYTAKEEIIIDAVERSHRLSSVAAKTQAEGTFARVRKLVGNQTILVLLLLAAAVLALLLNRMLIISPIRRSVENLDRREPIEERGCYEMRHLARVYNDVLKDNEEKTEALTYTASHDALTGVYNRAAFDRMYRKVEADEHIGLIVVDVDHFKQYNDEYGHDVGDKVLRKAVEALKGHFFLKDHISRIGGDEFCIIMPGTDQVHGDMMREKIRQINRELGESRDDLPPVTISAGIAFWDRPNPTASLFKDADSTLIELKRTRADCCAVYDGSQAGEADQG